MSKPSISPTKRLFFSLFALAFSALCLALLFWTGTFSELDRAAYDRLLLRKVNKNPGELNPRLVPVDLNDSSQESLGESLDSRLAFADLLWVLGDCNVRVGMDFIFQARLPGDGEFARSAGRLSSLVLAVSPVEENYANFSHAGLSLDERELLKKNLWYIKEHPGGRIPAARTFILSNPEISQAAPRLGHIGISPDSDGKHRRVPLFYRWEDGLIPSLPLLMAAEELGLEPEKMEFFPGRELVLPLSEEESLRIPVDETGALIIPYTSKWSGNQYRVSFDTLVKARTDPRLMENLISELAGSLALVADTTTAKRDFGITPFENVYPLSAIHLTVLSSILDGRFYRETPGGIKAAVVFICLAAAFFLGLLRKDIPYHAGFFGLFAGNILLELFLWQTRGMLPWCGLPLTGLFLMWLAGFIVRLFFRYREQLLFKNALERYFPRALAERVAAEGRTELEPSYKELSLLFSDISGFTKWSSDKAPETVHEFLSEYLESMAGIIFRNGGTVDKFMGDGILAFFGDPFDQPDHPSRCVRTALDMQAEARRLAALWKDRVGIDLKVRIGINTGRVIVGNLGTKTRIEYTVIGAAVNLAQRMESHAPLGGILLTAETRARVKGEFVFSGSKEVRVKGYDEPVEAYEVLGPAGPGK